MIAKNLLLILLIISAVDAMETTVNKTEEENLSTYKHIIGNVVRAKDLEKIFRNNGKITNFTQERLVVVKRSDNTYRYAWLENCPYIILGNVETGVHLVVEWKEKKRYKPVTQDSWEIPADIKNRLTENVPANSSEDTESESE